MLLAVEREGVNRRPAGRGDSDDLGVPPSEVMVPFLPTWMEERRCRAGLWIQRSLPRAFPQRTMDTGQREI